MLDSHIPAIVATTAGDSGDSEKKKEENRYYRNRRSNVVFTFVVLNDDSDRVDHSRNRYHNLMLSLQFIIVNDCDVSACNAARWCPFRECYDIVSSLVVTTSSYIYVCIPVFVSRYVGMYV